MALLLFFHAACCVAQTLPTASHVHVVQVSPAAGHYSEPSIAINPRNPRQVVVVFQGGRNIQGTGTAAYSTDGGLTFQQAQGTASPDWKVMGDVSTTFDNAGNAYLCNIVFDKLGTTSYWAHNVGRNGIIVRRSSDGGKTWNSSVSNVKTFPLGAEPGIQFEDEPRIYADNNPTSPYAGSLYVGWVEWQLTQSVMFISRSTDQAKTWSKPLRISTRAGLPRDDNGGLGGYTQATAADGTIYSAWSDGAGVVLTSSHDGGRTFAPSRPVVATGPTYFGEVPGVARVSGFPVIGIDVRQGHNRLYLCWSDYTNGDTDIFLASSPDRGKTWSPPIRVNNDSVHNGKDQFFPWMAIDPLTGTVFIDFYDRRSDDANRKTSLTLATSTNEGKTFENHALTTAAFNPANAFLSDYTWIDARNNQALIAWTETTATKTETVIKVATAALDNHHPAP